MRLKTDVADFAAKRNNAVRFAALKPEVAGGAGSRRSDPHDPPTEFTCSSATCSSLLGSGAVSAQTRTARRASRRTCTTWCGALRRWQ